MCARKDISVIYLCTVEKDGENGDDDDEDDGGDSEATVGIPEGGVGVEWSFWRLCEVGVFVLDCFLELGADVGE